MKFKDFLKKANKKGKDDIGQANWFINRIGEYERTKQHIKQMNREMNRDIYSDPELLKE